ALDKMFALNPAMPNLHRLYQAGGATIVHAAATAYRERSHFDGQDVLESGLARPGATSTGWLNRALGTLEPAGPAHPKAGHAVEARGRENGQGSDGGPPPPPAAQVRAFCSQSAGTAAKFLARPDGPRVGALAFDGWDTHANEGALDGRLSALLGALDGAIGAIETNMGAAWRETVVAIITEFGRTARINGTEGTDHEIGRASCRERV